LGPRDQFIGWDESTRLLYLQHIVNNNRFLILPWIRVQNLASHVLSLSLKRVRVDWEKQYDIEPYMVETFVDPEKFCGTSYLASNWSYLGCTKGFGRVGNKFVYHGKIKDIYVYIMNKRFRNIFNPNIERLESTKKDILNLLNGTPMHWDGILKDIGIEGYSIEIFNELFFNHINPYLEFLSRKEHLPHFIAYLKGLLSDLPHKTIESIAIAFENEREVRNLANFMTRSRFDNEGMLKEFQNESFQILSHPSGMITGDGCDFPKKGDNSAGVARQYCGQLGKTDTCQASVMMGYASTEGYGLIDYALYMPEKWFGKAYADRRKNCRIPKDLKFETKNVLLSRMIENAVRSGFFKGKYVGVDCSFGRDHVFLDSLPPDLIYFADVPNTHHVFIGHPDMVVPEYCGKGRRPVEAPSYPSIPVIDIANNKSLRWQDVVLGIGAKGPIIAKDKCIRVAEVRDGKPGKDIWLYIRKLEDGSTKFSLCNESKDASIQMIRTPALMRWSIEQCFKECKNYLGMDQYELRTWPGWRRHILLTFIAHLFITRLRREFSVSANTPGPAPIPLAPVPLNRYRDAALNFINGKNIEDKDIISCPEKPQQILTIGVIRDFIQQFLPKIGEAIKRMDYQMQKITQAFISHTKVKITKILSKI
jgi:SRSO17 transposase